MELSDRYFKRFKNNAIIVDGLILCDGKISFKTVTHGSNVRHVKINSSTYRINLNEMKQNYVMIVVKKNVVTTHPYFKDTIILQHGHLYSENDNDASVEIDSGYVILMVAKMKKKQLVNAFVWGTTQCNAVKKCKNSVITASNGHHGSSGKYYSFGHSAMYKTENLSSVRQYAMKTGLKDKLKVHSFATEDMVARELKDGIKSLGNLIPLIQNYIAPVFNFAEEMQHTVGDINIMKDEYSKYGIWKTVYCVNAETHALHTENDCSYTVITVPKQQFENKRSPTNFHFKLNDEEVVFLEMNNPITFMFSGKSLQHQQLCNAKVSDTNDIFINFAIYTNQKIFNHVRKSFARVFKSKNN